MKSLVLEIWAQRLGCTFEGATRALVFVAVAATAAVSLGCSAMASDDAGASSFVPGSGFGAGGSSNTNVALGGSQDFGAFRALVAAGQIPFPGDFDAAGFFAEHHLPLPTPDCGNRVCLQAMLGVMGNLMNGANCTMLELGLNSPLAADPGARPPLSLSVVVDVSGSMNTDDRIGFVRSGLELLIDGMRDGDRLALTTYSDNARTDFPMADVALNRAQVRGIVQGLQAVGGTNLYAGLEAGYQEVLRNYDSGRQNRVILLSDGQPTAGITGEPAIIDMSHGYNSDGVGLTTIGLGTSFNAQLMRNLALQADGNFYFLENSGAVNEVFTEELSFFTVPIAFDLTLELRTGSQYAFGAAHGSPFWTNTSEGGRLEVPSVFLAHRESDTDVTDEGGRRGGGSALIVEVMPKLLTDDGSDTSNADVAVIDVSYREPGTNAIVTDQVTVNYPFAPWITPETGFFQSADIAMVQKSFVMLNIYVGIERACGAFHGSGGGLPQPSEAIAELDRLIAAVEDYNVEVADTDIASDLELLNQLRQVMLQSIAPPEPTPIPQNPWPAD